MARLEPLIVDIRTVKPSSRLNRGALQSLVNQYIDALYTELDEAHAAVAKLSEEVEGLKAERNIAREETDAIIGGRN